MTLDELKSKYDVVCCEDLADYHSRHSAIFNLFKKHYKEAFSPNERLILYTSQELSQDFLNHIQRAAVAIDISNYFILIATPFDVESKLHNASKLYGNDDITFNFEIVQIKNSLLFGNSGYFKPSSTMCAYPFMGQAVGINNDSVRPCCKFLPSMGNLKINSIDEIFYSKSMEHIRQSLLKDQKVPECQICWDVEKNGLISHRQHGLTNYQHQLDQGWLDNIQVRKIELTPTNLCNFSCRICNPTASSTIAVEELKYATNDNDKRKLKKLVNINKDESTNSIPKRLLTSLEHLEVLHILGGEPFMWPGLTTVLDLLIEKDRASKIRLEFNSNGSIYPITLVDKLKKFKYIELLLSIDNIGPRFEIERGGKWENVYQNIIAFNNLKSEIFNVKAAITVNIQNVLYLDQIVDFFKNLNIDIVWWYLEDPEYLSIQRTTQKTKNLIYEKYHAHPEPELRAIANGVKASPAVCGQAFLDYMTKLDQRRGQDFKHTHQEIFDAMSI